MSRNLWLNLLGVGALLLYVGGAIWHQSPLVAIVLWIIAVLCMLYGAGRM